MDIGKEGRPFVIEPLVEPVPGRESAPAPVEPNYDPQPVDGCRVQIIAGDLAGESATVVDSEYRTLAYNHRPDDERLYWLEVDGGFGRVPALREQIATMDEVVA